MTPKMKDEIINGLVVAFCIALGAAVVAGAFGIVALIWYDVIWRWG